MCVTVIVAWFEPLVVMVVVLFLSMIVIDRTLYTFYSFVLFLFAVVWLLRCCVQLLSLVIYARFARYAYGKERGAEKNFVDVQISSAGNGSSSSWSGGTREMETKT